MFIMRPPPALPPPLGNVEDREKKEWNKKNLKRNTEMKNVM